MTTEKYSSGSLFLLLLSAYLVFPGRPQMDMLVKLYDLPDSREIFAALSKDGISVRRAMAPDKHKVVAFVKKEFSEAWASETEVAFARTPITCFIATRGRDLIGFANHDATAANFFGPTGVASGARNKGVGKALLFACLEDMRAQGFAYAIIGGVGPAEFYAKTVGAVAIEGSAPGIYRGLL
jgi:GNAT superfamily N-acetyltransferase